MTAIARVMFDPEVVIPSDHHAGSLAFWARLDAWTQGDVPYVGPETLRAVGELLGDPPIVPGLPGYDLRRIAGRVASRVLPPATPRISACEEHVLSRYEPIWGERENPLRLEFDIAAFPAQDSLALATDSSAWSNPVIDAHCNACNARHVELLYSPGAAPVGAWRKVFEQRGPSLDLLQEMAKVLFPAITFADDAWARAGDALGGGASLADLFHHLSVLNDFAPAIWNERVETREREQELASLGVVASPESANTRRNAAAIASRVFGFDHREVSCQWHTKLTPTNGRVHFEVEHETVMLGAIVSHLPI